jgi:chorismate dehydratase
VEVFPVTLASKTGAECAAFSKTDVLTQTRTRLGQFEFINSLPIVLPLERGEVRIEAEVTLESPANLNRLITSGALDVSAMSSFGYLSNTNLAFIPDVSISCSGPVGSVLLFSKHSLEDLANPERKVLVSAKSASSVNLLKVLFLEQFGRLPQFSADTTPEIEGEGVDAALVIGDRALEVDTSWSTRFLRIDMGDWWWRQTNLPMVFGLWAARMDWIEQNPSAYATISDALRQAKTAGLGSAFEAVLDVAEQRTGLARSRLQNYYRSQLNFDLTADHLAGMELYRSQLKKHGLL